MLSFFIFHKVNYMKISEILEMVTTANDNTALPAVNFNRTTKRLKKKKNKSDIMRMNFLMREDLNLAKFMYSNYKHDKHPQVMILDYNYTKDGEKNNRKDVLGWNVNYYDNKKEAIDTINDIDSFARMLSANKQEKYKRMSYFFPEQSKLIRRYNKEHIKGIRQKDGWFWKKTSLDTLENKDKDNL